jgi:hypothetical protein
MNICLCGASLAGRYDERVQTVRFDGSQACVCFHLITTMLVLVKIACTQRHGMKPFSGSRVPAGRILRSTAAG